MKHDRRQEILMAAMELFAKKGFRGTTTRDLASEADVNEAIIFRHFATKQELYATLLDYKAHSRAGLKSGSVNCAAMHGGLKIQFITPAYTPLPTGGLRVVFEYADLRSARWS